MRVGLIGCGAMGVRHARVVAADPHARLIWCVDRNPARAYALEHAYAVAGQREKPDVVIVAVDSSAHVEVAAPWLHDGIWCLVEKPLAPTFADALALDHRRCLVGHSERFNPGIRAVKVQRAQWARTERWVPDDGRAADVDVIADLLVHDIDVVQAWAGPLHARNVCGTIEAGRVVSVDAVVEGEGGFVARLRAGRGEPRRCVLGADVSGLFTVHYATGQAFRSSELQHDDTRDALTAQWQAVCGHLQSGSGAVTAKEALATLRVADDIRDALLRQHAHPDVVDSL